MSIKIMIVGIGEWGQNWIKSIQEDPRFRIVALVDNEISKSQSICKKFGINIDCAFSDIEQAIRKARPDAALITVPPAFHLEVALLCIRNGIQILSEKPLANDYFEANKLLENVREHNLVFMVSQDYRWQPSIQTVRNLIREGEIGEIGYLTYNHYQCHHLGGWREQMEDVIIEDMTIHHFDIMRYITGKECLRVSSESFNPAWSWYKGGAVAQINLLFDSDIHVSYLGSWVTSGWIDESTTGSIRIEGSLGSILLTSVGDVKISSKGKSELVPLIQMANTGRSYALNEFYNAINENIEPETNIKDNLKSFVITCAALQSKKENKPIEINEFRKNYI